MDICRLTVLAKFHSDTSYIIVFKSIMIRIFARSYQCIIGSSILYDIFFLPAIGFNRLIFVQRTAGSRILQKPINKNTLDN